MIAQDPNPAPASTEVTSVNLVPIGGLAQVLRSGDAYKAAGELVQRSIYAALSLAFPRNGSVASVARTISASNFWVGVAYGAGVFVAVGRAAPGSGTTTLGQYSRDGGKTWFPSVMPNGQWYCVAYGAGLFVALGQVGGTNLCATSVDGVKWTAQAAPPIVAGAVTYSGSLFVAVQVSTSASTGAMSSTDGINWTARTLPTSSPWSAIAYGNGKFVAASLTTTAGATSTDGISWTARTLPGGVNVQALAFGNGVFVAGGQNSGSGVVALFTSADGVTWATKELPQIVGNSSVYSVSFGDGVFIVNSSATGYSVVSYDGSTWYEKVTANPGGSAISALAYGAGTFFGTGAGTPAAITFYAETLETSAVLSDYLCLPGTAGQLFRVK